MKNAMKQVLILALCAVMVLTLWNSSFHYPAF